MIINSWNKVLLLLGNGYLLIAGAGVIVRGLVKISSVGTF